ncbi:MAG: filament integrity protein fraC [Scytonematopsis contorta HA4267-MV1]|jgi:hypothetical protein|nr:filament integrity protein fraC [Scytonematopsis contorta HA4267-MV1]
MFELPTLPSSFPLGAILFNFLFFLVAIPTEAFLLNNRLRFDKKTSMFYAICINLFSGVIGWTIFFLIEPSLPVYWKSELISYFFFNRFIKPVETSIILLGFIIFFATFLLKFLLLKVLLISLSDPGQKKEEEPTIQRYSRRARKFKLQNTNLVTTLLIANSASYSAIAAILLIRPSL